MRDTVDHDYSRHDNSQFTVRRFFGTKGKKNYVDKKELRVKLSSCRGHHQSEMRYDRGKA